MTITLQQFQVNERIDSDSFKAVATVLFNGVSGHYVHGNYNAVANIFRPDILGDPEFLEDHYDAIQSLVEKR